MKDIISKPNIDDIYTDIKNKIINSRSKMLKQIDTTMVEVYWYIGKVTYELSENGTRASYGKKVIEELSLKLSKEFGSGFSSVSLRRMRRFYEYYPNWSAVPTELSWTHFQELLKTPYIFEFVGLKENKNYLETDLEKALLSHLTEFLLE